MTNLPILLMTVNDKLVILTTIFDLEDPAPRLCPDCNAFHEERAYIQMPLPSLN